MIFYSKNKNELLVLTGAVYSFVAYLTAFTLEVLFIIDSAKRTNNALIPTITSSSLQPTPSISSPSSSSSSSTSSFISTQSSTANGLLDESVIQQQSAYDQAKFMLETMQSHMTISCLAISILYFIIFVSSLALITALILRSTYFLLIWICAMSTMCLPEFGLIIYVSIYGWGIDSRNGQTELLFYLLRATLNVIFVFRAHKLYKDWNYDKNFFIIKSGSSSNPIGGSRFFSGYDSPYFVGDSLTTTINPVFSSSTLDLNQYDRYHQDGNHKFSQNNNFPTRNIHYNNHLDYDFQTGSRAGRPRSVAYTPSNNITRMTTTSNQYYLANEEPDQNKSVYSNQMNDSHNKSERSRKLTPSKQMDYSERNQSMRSAEDDDDFTECEMDLDYRTLTNQHHYHAMADHQQNSSESRGWHNESRLEQYSNRYNYTGPEPESFQLNESGLAGDRNSQSQVGLSYSTQSLDRRHLRDFDFSLPEQVTLRPLGHQPFEYLRRPGSTNNLSSINNLNTHPSVMYSSNTKLHDLHHRYN